MDGRTSPKQYAPSTFPNNNKDIPDQVSQRAGPIALFLWHSGDRWLPWSVGYSLGRAQRHVRIHHASDADYLSALMPKTNQKSQHMRFWYISPIGPDKDSYT